MTDSAQARTPVSIVCVYNDPEVLGSCLGRSVTDGRAAAPATELIAVDNRDGSFATAAAALNHGASQARHSVVVFAHQDVYLHSLVRLEEVAHVLMASPDIGVIGAVGIDDGSRIVGRIRDRIMALGEPAPEPRDVESMDEVLFALRRTDAVAEPLADVADLGWHAYAVEYSARVRRRGLRATVADIPLTHNSLTTNLQHLDRAHAWIGASYPELLPLQTTCGTIRRPGIHPSVDVVRRRVSGVRTWTRESLVVRSLGVDAVIADIRFLIDDVVRLTGARSLRALDVIQDAAAPTSLQGIVRREVPYSAASVTADQARREIAGRRHDQAIVVTNLREADLMTLVDGARPDVVGVSEGAGMWALFGVDAERVAPLWSGRRQRPFAGLVPPRRPR